MKRQLKKLLTSPAIGLSLVALVAAAVFVPDLAHAAANINEVKNGVNAVGGNQAGNGAAAFTNLLESIINILLFLIGAIAVIMIIIGGIRYTTSNGDQAQVTSAKNTILYSIVGLVVAIMAYAIVNWVISNL